METFYWVILISIVAFTAGVVVHQTTARYRALRRVRGMVIRAKGQDGEYGVHLTRCLDKDWKSLLEEGACHRGDDILVARERAREIFDFLEPFAYSFALEVRKGEKTLETLGKTGRLACRQINMSS